MKKDQLLFFILFITMPCCLISMNDIEQQKTDLIKKIRADLCSPSYVRDVLPSDFSHLTTLLEWGKKTRESRLFMASAIRSFMENIKCVEYVSCTVLEIFLGQIPSLLGNYCTTHKANMYLNELTYDDGDVYQKLTTLFAHRMYHQLHVRYHDFEIDPSYFLNEVSRDLVSLVEEEITIEQLRTTIIRFIDLCLSKVMWDFRYPLKAWESVKKIGDRLCDLFEEPAIISELYDLSDLYRTLVIRFCFVLDVHHESMAQETYDHIRHDIEDGTLSFIELADYNGLCEKRKDYLLRHLIRGTCDESTTHRTCLDLSLSDQKC